MMAWLKRGREDDGDHSRKKQRSSSASSDTGTERAGTETCGGQIVLILVSDTHKEHESLKMPPKDQFSQDSVTVLACLGDFESASGIETWMEKQPYDHKLIICGNHDRTFKNLDAHVGAGRMYETYQDALDGGLEQQKGIKGFRKESLIRSAAFLHNAGVKLSNNSRRTLCIYGTPFHTHDPKNSSMNDRHFEKPESELTEIFARIPEITQVLLTHAGPFGYLDATGTEEHLGSSALKKRIDALHCLAVHAFGHCHAAQTSTPEMTDLIVQESGNKKNEGRDVRAVRDAKGRVFANAAGMKVPKGVHWKLGDNSDRKKQRAPLVLRLDPCVGGSGWDVSTMES